MQQPELFIRNYLPCNPRYMYIIQYIQLRTEKIVHQISNTYDIREKSEFYIGHRRKHCIFTVISSPFISHLVYQTTTCRAYFAIQLCRDCTKTLRTSSSRFIIFFSSRLCLMKRTSTVMKLKYGTCNILLGHLNHEKVEVNLKLC